jgi:hypothetical protein
MSCEWNDPVATIRTSVHLYIISALACVASTPQLFTSNEQ